MAFTEKPKIKDYAKVGIVDVKKYRCEKCGYYTRDEQEFNNHECMPDNNRGQLPSSA